MRSFFPIMTSRCRAARLLAAGLTLLTIFSSYGCGTPVVKTAALNADLMKRFPLPGALLQAREGNEQRIVLDTQWLRDVDPEAALTFAGYRGNDGAPAYGVAVVCDPSTDILLLRLLEDGETPLTVLADAQRRAYYARWVKIYRQNSAAASAGAKLIRISLQQALAEKRFAPPLPPPSQVFAVAANFPSHLTADLAISAPEVVQALAQTRPRVFQKYPPIPPPEGAMFEAHFSGLVGPFDRIAYPATIAVPVRNEDGKLMHVSTRVDYEAEIGAVLGRRLTWATVQHATDEELRAAVAGYVLVSDAKARNPQVVDRILNRERDDPAVSSPYLTGDADIDRMLGFWDKKTCQWWSYAAGWGDYAAMGPFLVAAPDTGVFPPRMLLGGRSYADEAKRGWPVPDGHRPQTLYLRQLTLVSEDHQTPDPMLWSIPQIIRAILAPDSAVRFSDAPVTLQTGDVICLGTPGGTVITAKPPLLVDVADTLLFWWEALDWHEAFFAGSEALYLNPGDAVFFWAEGLGFQYLPVERLPD